MAVSVEQLQFSCQMEMKNILDTLGKQLDTFLQI